MSAERMCCVGSGVEICTLPEGHDGMHHTRIGAGSSSWMTDSPIWVGGILDGYYAQPGSTEYEKRLELRRSTFGPPREVYQP